VAYADGMKIDPTNAALSQGISQAQAALTGKAMPEVTKAMDNMSTNEPKKTIESHGEVIGIDLGTTYSCVGVWKDGRVEIIPGSDGNRTMPSCVAFTEDSRLVGHAAKNQASMNPTNTVFDAKRLIGRHWKDSEVQKDAKHFPFDITEGDGGRPMMTVTSKGQPANFTPEEISGMILTQMKTVAEDFLGHSVSRAVITCPAYFNDAQRSATKDAGTIAGLEVLRIINEPTAAALAYGLDHAVHNAGTKNVLVFDLGGGTFDVSLLSIENGIFEVKATGGDTHLGGEDFDNTLVDFVAGEFKKKNKSAADCMANPRALRRLRTACEAAKRMLSAAVSASVEVESFIDGLDLNVTVSRAKFESLNEVHFQNTLETVKRVLKDAKAKAKDVGEVVLVGGSTRIPRIQSLLQEMFNHVELCKSINPDEAVAYGAAVQAAILGGVNDEATNQLLLVDVIPLSLGIETTGKVMSTLLKRNTSVPCKRTQVYTTEEDWQTEVDVVVYEGERTCVDGNNQLGKFTISGLQRAKRGEPKVDVTFEVDSNGILKIEARDQVTNAKADIVIANDRGRLTKDEIARMVTEAEGAKKDDEKRLHAIQARNDLESAIYFALDIANQEDMGDLESAARKAREWMEDHPDSSPRECNAQTARLEKAGGFTIERSFKEENA